MGQELDNSWHLSENTGESRLTEFEFLLWRVFYGFLRWQEDCQNSVNHDNLSGYELALLHIIRMKSRPKTIYEIGRLLNRDDMANVQYSIRKLVKLGLVEKAKPLSESTKTMAYTATKKGIKNTDAYSRTRKQILMKMFKDYNESEIDLENATKTLALLKGLYDEASRVTASYFSQPEKK